MTLLQNRKLKTMLNVLEHVYVDCPQLLYGNPSLVGKPGQHEFMFVLSKYNPAPPTTKGGAHCPVHPGLYAINPAGEPTAVIVNPAFTGRNIPCTHCTFGV
jgi:hypothetical protein